jgi:hypothetical protein
MRTFKLCHTIPACIAFFATPLVVHAQQQAANAPPPPQLERLEEGEASGVTIRGSGEQGRIVEKRAYGGRVTEVQVTSGKSTYYLKPNAPAGSAAYSDTQGNSLGAAQWRIGEFDLRRSDEAKTSEPAQGGPSAPPPPTGPIPSKN